MIMLGFLTVAFDSIYALVFAITISGTDIGNVNNNNNNNEAKEKKPLRACVCVHLCLLYGKVLSLLTQTTHELK